VVRERVSADATLKDAFVVGIFCEGTEVEHPEVGAVPSCQEALDVGTVVAIDALHADCREAHDDDLVGHIGEVFFCQTRLGCMHRRT
jgi:hypothetical protein